MVFILFPKLLSFQDLQMTPGSSVDMTEEEVTVVGSHCCTTCAYKEMGETDTDIQANGGSIRKHQN